MPERDAQRYAGRYERIAEQLEELFVPALDTDARMATTAALLHAKMPHFVWTGFYRAVGRDLLVGPYQGALACAILEPRGSGVCWSCVQRGETIVVPDVHAFEGHIVCDARSRSEIAIPVRGAEGAVVGVLDVDSNELDAFFEADRIGLERIAAMIGD
jgi:L-methionine (R)-S-oxide reductase